MLTKRITCQALTLLGAMLVACATGCMATPQNGEYLGDIDQPKYFGGATLQPNQAVEIQAFHPDTGDWETIARTRTGGKPYVDANGEWYLWAAKTVIADEYWTVYFQELLRADLRAVVNGDQPLATFHEGYDFTDDSLSLGEIWEQYGCGASVTVYGWH